MDVKQSIACCMRWWAALVPAPTVHVPRWATAMRGNEAAQPDRLAVQSTYGVHDAPVAFVTYLADIIGLLGAVPCASRKLGSAGLRGLQTSQTAKIPFWRVLF